jgi:hypothetical protein
MRIIHAIFCLFLCFCLEATLSAELTDIHGFRVQWNHYDNSQELYITNAKQTKCQLVAKATAEAAVSPLFLEKLVKKNDQVMIHVDEVSLNDQFKIILPDFRSLSINLVKKDKMVIISVLNTFPNSLPIFCYQLPVSAYMSTFFHGFNFEHDVWYLQIRSRYLDSEDLRSMSSKGTMFIKIVDNAILKSSYSFPLLYYAIYAFPLNNDRIVTLRLTETRRNYGLYTIYIYVTDASPTSRSLLQEYTPLDHLKPYIPTTWLYLLYHLCFAIAVFCSLFAAFDLFILIKIVQAYLSWFYGPPTNSLRRKKQE